MDSNLPQINGIPQIESVGTIADGWIVHNHLTGTHFKVQRIRKRCVGPCNCGEEPDPPAREHQCSHQAAVRRLLFDQWEYGKRSRRL